MKDMKTKQEIQEEKADKIRNQGYNDYIKQITPKHSCAKNMVNAFIFGGVICTFGQGLQNYFIYLGESEPIAQSYTSLILIAISVILTGFNLTAPIVKVAGAGFLVPITGFANGVAASAIEYKKHGQIYGIGTHMFNIAGPVIVYGMVTSAFFGCIYYMIMQLS